MLHLAGLKGDYLKVRADEDVLEQAVADLRSGAWDGLNITMPLKGEAARLADSLSPRASRAGSVNTLVRSGSGAHGESTDSTAFHDLMASDRFHGMGTTLVLGAGGTAAAALAALPADANVYVASRRTSQAEDLTGRLGGSVVSWSTAVADALVINTTPLGMAGEQLPDGVLEVATGLIDLPYGLEATPAISAAGLRGIPHADGHEFLLRQAIASFTLWTGAAIELDELNEALRKP